MDHKVKGLIMLGIAIFALAGQRGSLAQQPAADKQSTASSSAASALTAGLKAQATVESSSAAAQAVPSGGQSIPAAITAAAPKLKPGFFTCWGKAYLTDWAGTTPIGQAPAVTMKSIGAKTQALSIAADLIWHLQPSTGIRSGGRN
jgi:hypothetical protein